MRCRHAFETKATRKCGQRSLTRVTRPEVAEVLRERIFKRMRRFIAAF
jgi:hypothetical protein